MEAWVLFLASSIACQATFFCYRRFVVNDSPDETSTTFLERACFSLRNQRYLYRSFLVLVFFKGCMPHPYVSLFFCFHALLWHVFACLVLNIDWTFEFAGILLVFLIPSDPSFKRLLFSCLQRRRFFLPCCWWAGTFHLHAKLPLTPKEKSYYEEGKGKSFCFSSFINIQQRRSL